MHSTFMQKRSAMRRRESRLRERLRILAVLVLAFVSGSVVAAVDYTYDEAGRLVGVYAPNGEAAQYVYDPAGNVVEIKRFAAGQLAIIEFTPNKGPVGTSVTIYGTGYSTTPASNAVKFNGIAATVASATATKLVATVPSGATTGKITVTVAGNTATSLTDFVVGPAGAAPTISGFSPTTGAAGTSVTITGTNFDTTPANNLVQFNTTFTTATSSTTTQLIAVVPVGASSGKVKVGTPFGNATSASDFIVPPPNFSTADVVATGRITIDGSSANLNVAQTGKIGILMFDGTTGQRLGLGVSGVTTTPSGGYFYVSILDTKNHVIAAEATIGSTGGTLDIPPLPATGTYSIMVRTSGIYTASATYTLSTDLAGSVVVDGATASININRIGRNSAYTFTANAGDYLTVATTSVVIAGGGTLRLLRPNGLELAYGSLTSGGYFNAPVALESGTYTAFVSPAAPNTGTFELTVTRARTGTLTINGSSGKSQR